MWKGECLTGTYFTNMPVNIRSAYPEARWSCEFFHRCLGQGNIRCVKKPRITTDTGLQKPDLLVLGNNVNLIIDIRIRTDSGLEDLDVLHDGKCANMLSIILWLISIITPIKKLYQSRIAGEGQCPSNHSRALNLKVWLKTNIFQHCLPNTPCHCKNGRGIVVLEWLKLFNVCLNWIIHVDERILETM